VIDHAKLAPVRILTQTENDLVVVKPAGIATELTSDPRRVSLISRIRAAAPEGVTPRLVHRLDRVTRGVMIVSLTREAAAFYGDQIREGIWEKYYLARIATPPKATAGDLLGKHKAYIKEGPKHAEVVRAGGKVSLLDILAIEPAPGRPGHSHALIRLHTGRLHQVRVMLAALGSPLIGDDLYGGPPGEIYLEHIALWYVAFTTRGPTLAHDPKDPDREPLAPSLKQRLAEIVRR